MKTYRAGIKKLVSDMKPKLLGELFKAFGELAEFETPGGLTPEQFVVWKEEVGQESLRRLQDKLSKWKRRPRKKRGFAVPQNEDEA